MEAASDIRHVEDIFQGSGGLELYEQSWYPPGKSRAGVVLVHGAAEHSGRYGHVAEHLARNGFAVHAFDLRGHGRSEGKRGYVDSFNRYLNDLDLFLAHIRSRRPEEPLFLFGHSMGGTIATLFVIIHRPAVEGLLLSGPGIVPAKEVPSFMVRLAKLLGAFLPRLPLIKIDSRNISRDPEVVKQYDNDPLVLQKAFPARSTAQMKRAMTKIEERMEAVELPLLIMHGTADQLVDVAGSRQLYERASSEDKTLELYEGWYHEVLNEPEKERALADMTGWLKDRI